MVVETVACRSWWHWVNEEVGNIPHVRTRIKFAWWNCSAVGWLGVGSGWRNRIEEPQGRGPFLQSDNLRRKLKNWSISYIYRECWKFGLRLKILVIVIEHLSVYIISVYNFNDDWKAKLGRHPSWATKNVSWTFSRSWRWLCGFVWVWKIHGNTTWEWHENSFVANDMGILRSIRAVALPRPRQQKVRWHLWHLISAAPRRKEMIFNPSFQ